MPDTTTTERCYELYARYKLAEHLPASVRDLFEQRALEETPKRDDVAFARSRWWTLLSSAQAEQIAAAHAAAAGFAVSIHHECDDWDYADAADHLLAKLRNLRRGVSRACVVSGGEVTVRVTGDARTGGRNQQFALYCASKISGEDIAVLSAGTDGIDGNSDAAGAIVDGSTAGKIGDSEVQRALREFNAYPALEAADGLVITGPTGNNVRDLRILLAE
jgi:hydroxypyruvate reductase